MQLAKNAKLDSKTILKERDAIAPKMQDFLTKFASKILPTSCQDQLSSRKITEKAHDFLNAFQTKVFTRLDGEAEFLVLLESLLEIDLSPIKLQNKFHNCIALNCITLTHYMAAAGSTTAWELSAALRHQSHSLEEAGDRIRCNIQQKLRLKPFLLSPIEIDCFLVESGASEAQKKRSYDLVYSTKNRAVDSVAAVARAVSAAPQKPLFPSRVKSSIINDVYLHRHGFAGVYSSAAWRLIFSLTAETVHKNERVMFQLVNTIEDVRAYWRAALSPLSSDESLLQYQDDELARVVKQHLGTEWLLRAFCPCENAESFAYHFARELVSNLSRALTWVEDSLDVVAEHALILLYRTLTFSQGYELNGQFLSCAEYIEWLKTDSDAQDFLGLDRLLLSYFQHICPLLTQKITEAFSPAMTQENLFLDYFLQIANKVQVPSERLELSAIEDLRDQQQPEHIDRCIKSSLLLGLAAEAVRKFDEADKKMIELECEIGFYASKEEAADHLEGISKEELADQLAKHLAGHSEGISNEALADHLKGMSKEALADYLEGISKEALADDQPNFYTKLIAQYNRAYSEVFLRKIDQMLMAPETALAIIYAVSHLLQNSVPKVDCYYESPSLTLEALTQNVGLTRMPATTFYSVDSVAVDLTQNDEDQLSSHSDNDSVSSPASQYNHYDGYSF